MVLGAAVPASAQVVTAPLTTLAFVGEGTWKCAVTPDAAAVAKGRGKFTEYVLVDSNREVSVVPHELSRQGFEMTTISAVPNTSTGVTTFSVAFNSRENGTLNVNGTVTLTTLSGTLVWTAKDGKVYNYTFSGVPYTPNAVDSEN
jgi:hypothetical protein